MVIPSAAGYCRFGEYVGTSTPAKTGDADAYEFCILSWLTRICSCRLKKTNYVQSSTETEYEYGQGTKWTEPLRWCTPVYGDLA